MSQMLKSSGAMGAATLASRLLGMVREVAYARFMGDGPVASAFMLAFQIPNLFRRLLGEGALTAAFIPIFKEKEKSAGEIEMWHAANAVISGMIIAASAIIGLVLLGISLVLMWVDFDPETRLMLELLRIMFPYMLLVCLAAILMGMLNARGYFFIPSMGATLLNVVMITAVLGVAPHWGEKLDQQIFVVAVAVLVGGIGQVAFQLPTLRHQGYRFKWTRPWPNETVRQVIRKMIPGSIGVAAFQINMLTTYGLAFWWDETIVASFNYAVRLMELPQGVFGISLGTFLLPTLAGLAAEKKYPEFRQNLIQALGYLTFVNLIASVMLLVLADPIIRLLFERGAFGPLATQRAGFALACLAPGLLAFSMVNMVARAFYALGDTTTPMKISVFCFGLNIFFVLWLLGPFRQGGMGIANSLSACVNVWLLIYALRRKLKRLDMTPWKRLLLPMFTATAIAGVVAGLLSWWWERNIPNPDLLLELGAVFLPMLPGALIYWLVLLAFDVPQAREFLNLIQRKIKPA